MRIVVVEDNKTNLMILSRLVGKVPGCLVVPFSEPLEALGVTRRDGCDLVVVDYLMPVMNGVRVHRGAPRQSLDRRRAGHHGDERERSGCPAGRYRGRSHRLPDQTR